MASILYDETINALTRGILRPFRAVLPTSIKFPVNGTMKVRGKSAPAFKMKTNPTNAVTKFLFWNDIEGFEYNAVQVFLRLLPQSQVFFDIGSNIGYYSLLAASASNDRIETYAFEPMPSIYDYLATNIDLNEFRHIQALKLALSDSTGEAEFYAIKNPKFQNFPQLTGDGSLNANSSQNASKEYFTVNIDTLDNFVAKNLGDKKIDLIKLDTEANEHKVMAGATKVLSQHRPIIQCEILKNQIETELEQVLKPHNYLYFIATNKGLRKVATLQGNTTPFNDYYLVPAEKLELIKNTGLVL